MKIRLQYIAAFLSCAVSTSFCPAQNATGFATKANQLMERPEYRHARLGYELLSLDTGAVLASRNENEFFGPASTTKLLTVATALAVLGPDYRFRTAVYRSGPVVDGVLDGDLILVASGDPNLSARLHPDGTIIFENEDHSYGGRSVAGDPLHVLRLLASQVLQKGIHRIDGQVRVDTNLFPEGEREAGTNTVISPMALNDNLVDITITAGKQTDPVDVQISPTTSYVRITDDTKVSAPGSVATLSIVEDQASSLTHRILKLTGAVPEGAVVHLLYRVPSPSTFAAIAFADVLNQAGVLNTLGSRGPGSSPASTEYPDTHRVAEYDSPPLRETVRTILKVSQNLQSCILLKDVGVLRGSGDGSADARAFALQRKWLGDAGLDLGAVTGKTGAVTEALTPDFMARFLAYSFQQKFFPVIDAGLPVLGVDGSLAEIQRGSAAAGHVRAKTGTDMSRNPLGENTIVTAKGLTGYITTRRGHHVAFALYAGGVLGDPRNIGDRMSNDLGALAAAAYEEF
jgi:PBP4 family serine-type D-alanyl-D-alanine carboxypeptidase